MLIQYTHYPTGLNILPTLFKKKTLVSKGYYSNDT